MLVNVVGGETRRGFIVQRESNFTMTSEEVECAEKRMKQRWYDLVTAEQQGASLQTLDRMFNAYMLAVEEYNHCAERYLVEQAAAQHPETGSTVQKRKRRRKAS
ncbi:hypothetical protein EI42_04189 [Thermosporothrix hazakensis]|jgi:hypothetical protein|uniref:Uncharacterized protein n=2 Tax=Thermosporothrix hazakensis TaxID=644383 RepID=A0A326U690_THEHA|nr:hypothetical protein [Thermosporothrix hazakensis]PZW25696.1 hypothetical protein EI42_04189 [Thermosporothrix hazakensis]GCE48191.1 hypothetical protein KTH_30600 [Thermosporothrix hazakensis]